MSKNKPKPDATLAEKPPQVTKIDTMLGMLKRSEGADAKQLGEATGWQIHSVRGAIAGTLKKKLNLDVKDEKADGRTIYRIEG